MAASPTTEPPLWNSELLVVDAASLRESKTIFSSNYLETTRRIFHVKTHSFL
jgi:hypothetical protein